MEQLQYIIEDKTIAELLGVQNFSSDESAILELVKNSYDARASYVELRFSPDSLIVVDDGCGMNLKDIKNKWMHVGKSAKEYQTVLDNNQVRVLAGSKGIGRFALARLGESATVSTKKKRNKGVTWETDWNTSVVSQNDSLKNEGTRIIIQGLRAKWTRKKVQNLAGFLSKTYNDDKMSISIVHPDIAIDVVPYINEFIPGRNCLSRIVLNYNSSNQELVTEVFSDEFNDSAKEYCKSIDLKHNKQIVNLVDELKDSDELDVSVHELAQYLSKLGDFNAEFAFSISPSKTDVEKFLYKHDTLPEEALKGVILYRNAFSISSYEGKKDWLGFGKRSRKSPAAATHPTGAWRVRENQIAGKVEIDKKRNAVLQDLSNRQGLDENVRILNVLATVGLKASSVAHEMRNDRNSIAENINKIISALREYGMWEELNSAKKTDKAYRNIPFLLEKNRQVSTKILAFMNVMLSEIEKKQFEVKWQSVFDIIQRIKKNWEEDYAWIRIALAMEDDICYHISEDCLQVIFDNLILNSVQQNQKMSHLSITISAALKGNELVFSYMDDGKGLDKKYLSNPRRILEVHETTRKNGHGLGMWIVNNTVVMTGGEIMTIGGEKGFVIDFSIGGAD